MYFDYMGMSDGHWDGGHCVMGVPDLSKEYYFAEGTTRAGFEEWLTIQNPHDHEISVSAVYQMQAGQGSPVTRAVLPSGRGTASPSSSRRGGHGEGCVDQAHRRRGLPGGAPHVFPVCMGSLGRRPLRHRGHGDLSADWFFAEGYTGSGFDEWLCLQNPGTKESTVEVTYLHPGSRSPGPKDGQGGCRLPRDHLRQFRCRPGLPAIHLLRVTSGPDIVAERPMYFDFYGWDGGHDVVGYVPMTFTGSLTSGGHVRFRTRRRL